MVDADDVQGYRTKYDNQMDLLEEADIDENDREQIRKWVIHLRANDTDVDSLGTVVGHLNRIRLATERGHLPLVEFDGVDDVNALKLHLEDRHGLSEGTIRNYMKAVRKFFMWRGEEWGEDISVGSPPDRKHDPDEEITPDELDAMLTAANEFEPAAREKALIALLRDTGLRIGAVLSFQMRHVDFEGKRGTLTINTEANVKDASGPKPVTWSRGYVSNWLAEHPRPDVPNAALIHKDRKLEDDEDGALRQQYAGRRIKKIAKAAGLDPDRIHAHLFRGTAISEWMRDEVSDQTIKHRVDWSEDSREFSTYSMVTDEEMNNVVFDHYGIGDEEDGSRGPPVIDCELCGATLRPDESLCPDCGFPVDDTMDDEIQEVIDGLRTVMVESDDREERRAAAKAEQDVTRDPAFASEVASLLRDGD